MTRLLVCGGRDFTDYHTLVEVLNGFHAAHTVTVLIEGGALGADRFARRWATDRGIPVETYEAEWARYGRSAGPRRNIRMLTEGKPDQVIAFPGGNGTVNMVRLARNMSIPVMEVVE